MSRNASDEYQKTAINFIGLEPGVNYVNTRYTAAQVGCAGGTIKICGVEIGQGPGVVPPGGTVVVSRRDGYTNFAAVMEWPEAMKASLQVSAEQVKDWIEIRGEKPTCHVFGCTIPSGIPHEHPAGVSAVMRDPAAPLDDAERYELNCLRAEIRKHKEDMIHLASLTPPPMTFVVDDPMVPGRKLRDSLLMAGHNDQVNSAASNTGELITDDELAQWAYKLAGSFDQGEPRRLSVAQIAGRIATGIVLFIGIAAIAILSAMNAGVL